MRTRPVGARALLAEVGSPAEAAALAAWLRGAGAAADDIVPAARSVLLDGVDPGAVAALLQTWPGGSAIAPARSVEVPVSYDGPDLELVASRWQVSVDEVVRRHTSLTFTSAFCGFAPGFAYLSGLPEQWWLPRLADPRPRVPAGSVAIGGEWCGVYPTASPGGWLLLGRTHVSLWDETAVEPALLAPGTQVRLPHSEQAGIEVVEAGALTTIQDIGRVGWAHLGVPRAGALDAPAAALANRLVGNPASAAVLETVLGGLTLRNAGPGRWGALTGATTPRTFWWASGAEVRVPEPTYGVRSYLAVAGGVAVAPVLGSRSTDTLAWVGPPRVVDGAMLPLGEPSGPPRPLDVPPVRRGDGLRLLPGPRADWVASLDPLLTAEWTVRPDSDRVGLRLEGPRLERARRDELPSEGMALGAVQVPPSGWPIVFLADHPPTGGYPVVGVVHPDDLWQCAQARPGERVRFRQVATG